MTWTGPTLSELKQGAGCSGATRPVPQCFAVTRMLSQCANSVALPCHSTVPDEAQQVLSDPSVRCCGWCGSARRSKTAAQLTTPCAVRISHQLWRRCFGKPNMVDLIKIAQNPFEVRPALAPAKMLSFGRLAFAVLSVTFWRSVS